MDSTVAQSELAPLRRFAPKFCCPLLSSAHVARPHLVRLLNDGLQYRLTLICAAAGAGKTSLLSEWYAQSLPSGLPAAWLSLDKSDNDPARFWECLLTAVERLFIPTDSATIMASLEIARASADMHVLLTAFIQAITLIPHPFVLILDDYHEIVAPQISAALALLCKYQPPHMHLFIASRTEPALPLAWLRAQGQLHELRSADLQFSDEEATRFLAPIPGLALLENEVRSLKICTEGWITGLRLARLALARHNDATRFLATFSGRHQYIADYFLAEVLSQQPPHLQTFLLSTAVLECLCGPLCDALLVRDDGQAMLEQLVQMNLFVVQLDEQQRWYRYHQLFRDFLYATLQRTRPAISVELHQRACEWLAHHNLLTEAIEHALLAQDFALALSLIEQIVATLVRRRENQTLLRWFAQFPLALLSQRSQLCQVYAEVLLTTGQVDAAECILTSLTEDSAIANALRTVIAAARSASQVARPVFSTEKRDLSHVLALAQGMTHAIHGESEQAELAYSEARRKSVAASDYYTTLLSYCQQAAQYQAQGKLRLAARTYQAAIDFNQRHLMQGMHMMQDAGLAYLGLGDIQREHNELTAAQCTVVEGIRQSDIAGNAGVQLFGHTMLAHIKYALDDTTACRAAMCEVERLLRGHQFPTLIVAPVIEAMTRLSLRFNDRQEAEHWSQFSVDVSEVSDSSDIISTFVRLTAARLLLARRAFDEALAVLAQLQQLCEEKTYTGTLIPTLIVQAMALHRKNQTSQALPFLARALSLTEPEDYIRIFVDEGQAMAELLTKLGKMQTRKRGVSYRFSTSYLNQLLSAFGNRAQEQERHAEMKGTDREIAIPQHILPLSTREQEVLQLIVHGFSNQEITHKMVVEMSTLKTHVRHLYRKLNVRNRGQAIVRAKELHLL